MVLDFDQYEDLLWEKFSISNNRASDKPHWLRYCHCAKLEDLLFQSDFCVLVAST